MRSRDKVSIMSMIFGCTQFIWPLGMIPLQTSLRFQMYSTATYIALGLANCSDDTCLLGTKDDFMKAMENQESSVPSHTHTY